MWLFLKLLFCFVQLYACYTLFFTLTHLFIPKPLVLHQDSSILASRDLRLEKRTLFR